MTMLNVYDRQTLKKVAVLENAFSITEVQELNQIYMLSFALPAEDKKTQYCLPRNYIRYGDDGELYRIKAPHLTDSDTSVITYECEHAITTLCDSVMFGSYTYGGAGVRTSEVIKWLLNEERQKAGNWELLECDFDRRFEYNWEQENILNALYSIPREFAEPYKWVFDTKSYPWKISLKRIDPNAQPEFYLRAKSNILSSGTAADYANICTRIYPLGYGEGVNQLNITAATVDGDGNAVETGGTRYGKTYIDSPKSIQDMYGVVEKVMVDRRFENANTLYAYAKSMLDLYQTPSMSRTFDVTDLYPLTHQSWDDAQVGKICKMVQDGTTAYITRTCRVWDVAGDLQIDLSTKASGIAQNVADLADRIRIESVYAQGATQLYQHSKDANATPEKGMVISLYFPSEMKQINKVLMRLKLNKFRSYSQTTSSNGGATLTIAEANKKTKTQESSTSTKITVDVPEQKVTTDMTADTGMDMTTTAGGGSSASTSASIGTSVITGITSSNEVWQSNNGYSVKTTGTNVSVDEFDTENSVRENDGTENGVTDTPTPYQGGSGHYHSFWRPYSHHHPVKGLELKIPALNLNVWQLRHFHEINITKEEKFGSHTHTVSFGDHTHKLNIKHQHKFKIGQFSFDVPLPAHTHPVVIPGHTHTIPPHTHGIQAGIYESGNPSFFDIYVGNTLKTRVSSTSYDGDITQWLLNDKRQIPRNTWIDVTIVPDDLAYVVSTVFIQGFVQSRGGGNY